MAYSKRDLEIALEILWEDYERVTGAQTRIDTRNKHPAINEVAEYGKNGPAGLGLGNIGGHAIG